MKIKYTFLVFLLLAFVGFSNAQTDGIVYQAIIIDNNAQEIPGVDIPSNNLPNVTLQVRFTIIDNLSNLEYQETHETTTDAYGMINLMVGRGIPAMGAFNEVYWNDSKFLQVEIDLNDGNGMVEFSYQELTYIPYVKHREIVATSTLDVDGETNLNSDLTVNNASPTLLSGDLTVEGLVSFDGELAVGGDTQLYSDLDVDGVTNLNSDLSVNNGAPTILSGDLTVQGISTFQDANFENITVAQNSNLNVLDVLGISTLNNTLHVNGLSNLNGQVTINASVTGGEGNYNAYPLRVEGSPQGIAVRLSAGDPNNSNNFITFFNNVGNAVGRIEGETTNAEVTNSAEFIFEESILVAEEVKAIVNQGTSFTPTVVAGVGAAAGPCSACILSAAADLVLATANLVAFNVFALSDLGVTYQSGSADYAEWLARSNPNEKVVSGDIVGVNGGKISKYTVNCQHYMVVSTKPVVLGNMPMNGNEALYEKVAFMGQIPVKVRGIVLQGDYILPSGLNDGTGIGVSPKKIKPEQYRQIVGVAWSEALINESISLVNMAIGLNTNDVANLAVEQEKKIKVLEAKFDILEQRLLALENGTVGVFNSEETSSENENNIAQKELTKSELITSFMPSELSDEVMEEAMLYLETAYKDNGINIENHKGLHKLFNDLNYRTEIIKKAQHTYKKAYHRLLEKHND